MTPFTADRSAQVGAWGEATLISRIKTWLGAATPPSPMGIGDDCAVLPRLKGHPLVTVDPVVYGVHFDDTVSPRWAGEKLFKRNLSDIAAMGGRPVAAVVALGLESTVSAAWLRDFYLGLAAVSRRYRVPVVGGDVTTQPGFSASLTLIGESSKRILTRTGAKIGDSLFVTGTLGRTLSTGHHYRFAPRLAEGAWLARQQDVRSLIDVSDGIAKDVHTLAPANGAVHLDESALPLRAGASVAEALTDGEDYELLFSVAKKTSVAAFRQRWKRAFPQTRLTCIGSFAAPSGAGPGALGKLHGYEHLRQA